MITLCWRASARNVLPRTRLSSVYNSKAFMAAFSNCPMFSRNIRPAAREIIEPSDQAFPRGIRIDFRLAQQTDSEVGGPITILAEIVANILGDVDEGGKICVACDGARIIDQLRYQIVGRPGDHCDENAGKE